MPWHLTFDIANIIQFKQNHIKSIENVKMMWNIKDMRFVILDDKLNVAWEAEDVARYGIEIEPFNFRTEEPPEYGKDLFDNIIAKFKEQDPCEKWLHLCCDQGDNCSRSHFFPTNDVIQYHTERLR